MSTTPTNRQVGPNSKFQKGLFSQLSQSALISQQMIMGGKRNGNASPINSNLDRDNRQFEQVRASGSPYETANTSSDALNPKRQSGAKSNSNIKAQAVSLPDNRSRTPLPVKSNMRNQTGERLALGAKRQSAVQIKTRQSKTPRITSSAAASRADEATPSQNISAVKRVGANNYQARAKVDTGLRRGDDD